MKTMRYYCAVIAVLILAGLAGCGGGADEGVAAIVNGYRITYDELEDYHRQQMPGQDDPPSEEQSRMLRLNLLREMIDRQILLQKAESVGLVAVDDEVDARYKEFRTPFPSDEEFEASLRERGMSPAELQVFIRRNLTIEKLFNREITSRVSVTEPEMRQYYEENSASFSRPEPQMHLAQIVVTSEAESPPPNLLNDDAKDRAAASAKITMLAQRLAAGEDFDTLAQNYSEDPASTPSGGDLGFIPQSSLEKAPLALRRIVAALSPGETSPVVEIDGVYRIIRYMEQQPAGLRDFSDPGVQQEIQETLRNRKDQLLRSAFLEVARSEADVENLLAKQIVDSYGIAD
jgi:peptidyl-prolyl cis-trans isomerase SurA